MHITEMTHDQKKDEKCQKWTNCLRRGGGLIRKLQCHPCLKKTSLVAFSVRTYAAQPIRGHTKKIDAPFSRQQLAWRKNELAKLWQPMHANLLVHNQIGAYAMVNDQFFGSAAVGSHPNTP